MKNNNTMKKLEITKEYIRAVARGFSNNLLLTGKQGTGKTFLVTKVLEEEKANYVVVTSSVSALTLYKTLYNYSKPGKIIVFDDMDGLFEDDKAYSLMLSAMGDRRVMWLSTTSLLGTCPPKFEFEGRIIVLANVIRAGKKIKEDAIRSRCLHYDLSLGNSEMIDFMTEIAQKPTENLTTEQRLEVVDFIKKNIDVSTTQLSLRTQQRLEELYAFNNDCWKNLALPFLSKDNIKQTLLDCMDNCNTVTEQQEEFSRRTGLSRRTFFRLKEECHNAK